MARRVATELTMQAAQYLAEARLVEKTTAAVDAEMGQLDRSIDRVDRDMAQLAASSAVAARQVDNLGDQARGAGRDFSVLEARIFASRARIRELNLEIASTGGADRDLFKQLRSEQSGLRELERVAKVAADSIGGKVAGISADTTSSSSGAGRMMTNPYVIGGLLTAVTAVAPALGAIVSGALAGAIGTGGLAAGILSAAKDPHVRAAAGEFGDAISAEFFRGGTAFVGPVIESLHILEAGFEALEVPEALAKLAPTTTVIADGFVRMAKEAMPGLNAAFGRMEAFAVAAADGMASLGGSLGTFVDEVTASPGAVLGLKHGLEAIGVAAVLVGKELKYLSDVYGGYLLIASKIEDSPILRALLLGGVSGHFLPSGFDDEIARIRKEMEGMGPAATDGEHVIQSFGEAVDRATEETNIFNRALDKTYSAFLDFTGAEISAEQAVDDLADAFAEHGTTLDVDTQAGRDNLRILKDLADVAMDASRKKLAETHSVEEANAVYETYRQKLYDTFIAAGKTAEEAQALVDKWLALDQLADIEKFVNIHENTYRATFGPAPGPTWGGGFQEFAEGGTVQGPAGSPQWALVHAGEKVLTAQQQAQQWNGGVVAAADRTITIIVKDTSGRTLRQELITEAANRNVSPVSVQAAYP